MHCPRCRSMSFEMVETFEEFEYRSVSNGVISSTADRWPGSLLRTQCSCECGHSWTPRKATLDTLERTCNYQEDEG